MAPDPRPEGGALARTFDALRHQAFRWLWLSRLGGSATLQIGMLARGWLVYELTGSALALGWVSAARGVAVLLFAPLGGVASDRMNRRTLLVLTRVAVGLISLVLAGLILGGMIRVWHVAAATLLEGVCFSFMLPCQQALVYDLVPRRTVMNALSLNALGMGIMGVVFPSVTGVLLDSIGTGGVYLIRAVGYLLVVLGLLQVRPQEAREESDATTSVGRELRDGLAYAHSRPIIVVLLLLTMARFLFGMPYRTFMPKYSSDVHALDGTGYGLLMSAPGLGALAASLGLAWVGDLSSKGTLLSASGVLMGAALASLWLAPTVWVAGAALVLVGALGSVLRISNQTLLQHTAQSELRGRVMSLYTMTTGLAPLVVIPAGAAADQYGVGAVLAAMGLLLVLSYGVAWILFRPLRAA